MRNTLNISGGEEVFRSQHQNYGITFQNLWNFQTLCLLLRKTWRLICTWSICLNLNCNMLQCVMWLFTPLYIFLHVYRLILCYFGGCAVKHHECRLWRIPALYKLPLLLLLLVVVVYGAMPMHIIMRNLFIYHMLVHEQLMDRSRPI